MLSHTRGASGTTEMPYIYSKETSNTINMACFYYLVKAWSAWQKKKGKRWVGNNYKRFKASKHTKKFLKKVPEANAWWGAWDRIGMEINLRFVNRFITMNKLHCNNCWNSCLDQLSNWRISHWKHWHLEKGHVRVIEKINNELNCLTQKQNKRKKKKTSRDKERREKKKKKKERKRGKYPCDKKRI